MEEIQLTYHVCSPTKYRREVFDIEIGEELEKLFSQIAKEKGIRLLASGHWLDHAHFLIQISPKDDMSIVVKYLKGISARKLFQKFPKLRNKIRSGHLWAKRYYSKLVPKHEIVDTKKYIENQQVHHTRKTA